MATPVTVSGGAPPLARPAESTKSVFAGTSLACLSGTRLRPSLTRPESVHHGRVHVHGCGPGDLGVGLDAIDGLEVGLLGEVVDRLAVLDRWGAGLVAGEQLCHRVVAGCALEPEEVGDAGVRRLDRCVLALRLLVTCAPAARRARHAPTLCRGTRAAQAQRRDHRIPNPP